MVVNENILAIAKDLEKQELEAASCTLPVNGYIQLLAIYLYQNDVCNAKFLWKRISSQVKASSSELGQVWVVGQHMWKRDFPAIYEALNSTNWSDCIAEIMESLRESVRNRAVELISQAYSSIPLEKVAAMTGLSVEVAGAACVDRGWTVESDSHMVHPIKLPVQILRDTSSENQLYKLTEFVAFLEN